MNKLPNFKAKNAVFEEIIALLVANQLTLVDLQAYVDAAEVVQEYLNRRSTDPKQTMERLFQLKSLAIAQTSDGSYIDARVQMMAHALESLTGG